MTRRAANSRQRLNTVTNDGKYATADEAGYTSLLAANLNMLVDRQSGLRSGLKTYSCPFRIPVVPAVNRSVYACSRVLLVQAELRVAAEAARHQNARQIVLRLAGHRTSDAMGC